MKQFIWTYGRRNIITYLRLKHRMLKFQFMTIRTNVTTDTTKVADGNKFRNISIHNSKFKLRFWFLPQQRTIWSNMTNNTTKVIGWHKNIFIMLSNSRFRLGFRNFSVYIKTFTFVYPSKISIFFIIPLKMRDINFLSFLRETKTLLLSTTGLVLVKFSILALDSTNSCSKLFIFSS